MKLFWRKTAMRDLAEIADYISQESEQTAWLVEMRIHEAARLLRTMPAMGRPGRIDGTRELIVPRTPFILVYRIQAGTIRVLRILRAVRRWPARFD